jgi:hypothetical protein
VRGTRDRFRRAELDDRRDRGGQNSDELIEPAAVIASHVNEGATSGGKVRPDSRTAAFVNQVKGRPVHLALSGKTMDFDGNAKCVSGC